MSVPPRVLEPEFVPIATVMESLAEVTTLSLASRTETPTVIVEPAAVLEAGWVEMASLVAEPGTISKVLVVAEVSPVAEAVRV